MVGKYPHFGQALPVSHPHPHYPLVKSSLLLFKLDRFPSIGWLNPDSGSSLSGVSVDSGSWGFPAPSSRHWCFSSQKAAAYASGHPLSAGTRHFSRSSYLKQKKDLKMIKNQSKNLQTYWKAKVWAHKKMDKQLIASFQSYWIFEVPIRAIAIWDCHEEWAVIMYRFARCSRANPWHAASGS